MIDPITPQAARAYQSQQRIPDVVFQAFNTLIQESFHHGRAHFKQDEVVDLLRDQIDIEKAFDHNWFDVEPHYRKAGWTVEYDSPGYSEDYPASFTFTAPHDTPPSSSTA